MALVLISRPRASKMRCAGLIRCHAIVCATALVSVEKQAYGSELDFQFSHVCGIKCVTASVVVVFACFSLIS